MYCINHVINTDNDQEFAERLTIKRKIQQYLPEEAPVQQMANEAIIQYNINTYFIYLKNCNDYSNSGKLI